MSELPERPLLRGLDVKQFAERGQTLYGLTDPLKVSNEAIGLNVTGILVCQLLDGTRTIAEVVQEFKKRHGIEIGSDSVEQLVRALDRALFLQGERVRAALEEWRRDPVRRPACAGGAYPGEPHALETFLVRQYTRD